MEKQGLKAEALFSSGGNPRLMAGFGIFGGQGAFLEPVRWLLSKLWHTTGPAFSQRALGKSFVVTKMLTLNKGEHHPGAHLFIWSRGVEVRCVCHNYGERTDGAIYQQPATSECSYSALDCGLQSPAREAQEKLSICLRN